MKAATALEDEKELLLTGTHDLQVQPLLRSYDEDNWLDTYKDWPADMRQAGHTAATLLAKLSKYMDRNIVGGDLQDKRASTVLTTDPNDIVGPIHPKAMPVILTTEAEIEQWMTAPAEEALRLQRPLPNSMLEIVARGAKEDPPSADAGLLL